MGRGVIIFAAIGLAAYAAFKLFDNAASNIADACEGFGLDPHVPHGGSVPKRSTALSPVSHPLNCGAGELCVPNN